MDIVSQSLSQARPKLLDRVRQTMRTRHYSQNTEAAYVAWIKRFIFYHDKSQPAGMGEGEVTQFLSSLAVEGHVSASTEPGSQRAALPLPGGFQSAPGMVILTVMCQETHRGGDG